MLHIMATELMSARDATSPELYHRRAFMAEQRRAKRAARTAWFAKLRASPEKLGVFSQVKVPPSTPHGVR
ncbi:hypothetical protein [Celeribacter sp. PS-C1]|uniref:hypothetical protein n=1 Tax=Celeribacter sp. PS-C1 TaxID=2820813 RepID=UPI001CA54402|nr:hypothetical protein [Celeribacter sp. PS-C1]MBW6416225.1 hypothetical protein [Celeribacter sp. PS-C1]